MNAHAGMAAICFVLAESNILLMKHGESSFAAGRWSVIGGHVEHDETPDQAIRREVEEEAGLILKDCRHAGHVLLYEMGAGPITSLSLFVSTQHQGEIRGSDEGVPVWWPLPQVNALNLVGYLRLILPLVLTPESFLSGTIQIERAGAPVHWSLTHHTICQPETLKG